MTQWETEWSKEKMPTIPIFTHFSFIKESPKIPLLYLTADGASLLYPIVRSEVY